MNLWKKLTEKNEIYCASEYISVIERFVLDSLDVFKTSVYNIHIQNYTTLDFIKAAKYSVTEHMSKMRLETLGSTYKKTEHTSEFELDRYNIIPENHAIYGELVTKIKEEDGDNLDYIMYIPRPFEVSQFYNIDIVKVYPLCAIEYIDQGEKDIKVMVISADLIPHIGPNFDMFVHNFVYFLSTQLIRLMLVKGKPNDNVNCNIERLIGFEEISKYINSRKVL